MTTIKAGDEVRVFTPARYDRNGPLDGRPGTVIRAGRRYATAFYEGENCREEVAFDMETGRERGGGIGRHVKTPGQVDRDQRLKAAMFTLHEAGLEPRLGHKLSVELAEALAKVASSFTGQEG